MVEEQGSGERLAWAAKAVVRLEARAEDWRVGKVAVAVALQVAVAATEVAAAVAVAVVPQRA